MGKRLIIKGADFSENAIPSNRWYNTYENLLGAAGSYSVTHVCMKSDTVAELGLVGKPINAIRFYSAIDDEMGVSVNKVKLTEGKDFEVLTDYATISVSAGINELVLPESIVLSEGESLRFGHVKNIITYNSVSGNIQTPEGWVGFNSSSYLESSRFLIEVGFIV